MSQYFFDPKTPAVFHERLQSAITNISNTNPMSEKSRVYRNISNGFNDFCNEVSASLPEGYQVKMSVEHGGYDIELILPDGTAFSPDNDNMISCIEDAVAYAIMHKKRKV